MGQALGEMLGDRRGDDWLVGPSSQEFWHSLDRRIPQFVTYRELHPGECPGILIAEPEPLQFLIACLSAQVAGCTVVLASPDWGQQERQQAQALVNCRWDALIDPDLGVYPCHVPSGQPGQILIP
ncbi:MAG: hypothetical protein AAFW95_01075, partial [Cyanobacteria bacterium J06638_6]